jgi:DNA-binding transcriptional regulator YiaG
MAKAKTPWPNKATSWSYFMQAIEPSSKEINEAFPEYHPMWVIQSQDKIVSGEHFKAMRTHLLRITRAECAAYLRVTAAVIQKWETGKAPLPFAAFELLRLVYESVHFRLSHKDWQGWFIKPDGRLVCPDRGNLSFSPDELAFIRETHTVKSMYQRENEKLREEIEPLRAELAELKQINGNDGLLDELKAIEARLATLTAQVSINKVVPINRSKSTQEVKAA